MCLAALDAIVAHNFTLLDAIVGQVGALLYLRKKGAASACTPKSRLTTCRTPEPTR